MSTLLNYGPDDRLDIILDNLSRDIFGHVSSGNYLLYMISLEWISSLIYVPHEDEIGNDYPQLIMKDFSDSSEIIQLKNYNGSFDFHELKRKQFDPQIEVHFKVDKLYKNQQDFDYVFFSQSVCYTLKSTDFMMDIFREYIDFESFRDSIA